MASYSSLSPLSHLCVRGRSCCLGPDSALEAQALTARVRDKPLGLRCDICPLASEAPTVCGTLGWAVYQPGSMCAQALPSGSQHTICWRQRRKLGTVVEGRGAPRREASPIWEDVREEVAFKYESGQAPRSNHHEQEIQRPVLPSFQLRDL